MKAILIGVLFGFLLSGIVMAFLTVALPHSTSRWLPLPVFVVMSALSVYLTRQAMRTPTK